MKTLAIGTLLGASLVLTACKEKSKTEGGGAATTAEEAKKADSHVLASKGSRLPAKGQSLTKENSGDMKGTVSVEAGPQKMEGKMDRTETGVETWAYVADNKARRTLESKTVNSKMTLMGQDQPSPEEKDALVGVPVIIELKDGTYTASLESGTPTAEQTTELGKLNDSLKENSDVAMYGETPRKVGDKWTVDPKALGGFGEMKDMTGTFTMEFVEIKDFQGEPCAVLKSQFDVTGSAAEGEEDGPKMTMKLKGDAISHRSLANKVDLEAKITANMTMDGSPAPQVKMHVEGPFNMTQKTKVTK